MKFFKTLIVSFFAVFCIEETVAQRAYNFEQNHVSCEGYSFSTAQLANFNSDISGLIPDGWHALDGTSYGSGPFISITVTAEEPELVLVLYSHTATEEYRDTLIIQVVLKPRIELDKKDITVCKGEEITTFVDYANSGAQHIEWINRTTGVAYSLGTSIPITEYTRFAITASNDYCQYDRNAVEYQVFIRESVDTNDLDVIQDIDVLSCPGCPINLNDQIVYNEFVDRGEPGTLIWYKNGVEVSPEVSLAYSESGVLRYITYFNGTLYKTDGCGTHTRTLEGVEIRMNVMPSDCKLGAMWHLSGTNRLTDFPCKEQLFDIINPQAEGFEITDQEILSYSGTTPPILKTTMTYNGRTTYRYAYEPKPFDTIQIRVTYLNKCAPPDSPAPEPYIATLYFRTDAKPYVSSQFCKGDSLYLYFEASCAGMYFESVEFLLDKHKPDFNKKPSGWMHENLYGSLVYSYKDTVCYWDVDNNKIPVVIHYELCGDKKTDTINIMPILRNDCYPVLSMPNGTCMGDTNWIKVFERRVPQAYIKELTWDFPSGLIDDAGNVDSLWETGGTTLTYWKKIVPYTTDSIKYTLVYCEGGFDTIIRGAIHNTSVLCKPSLDFGVKYMYCRGEEIPATIYMSNINGRLLSAKFIPTNGVLKSDSIGSKWNIDRLAYSYKLRAQKIGYVDYTIRYSYGKRDTTLKGQEWIAIKNDLSAVDLGTETNCQMSMLLTGVATPFNNTYCEGEQVKIQISPEAASIDKEVIDIVWDNPDITLAPNSPSAAGIYNYTFEAKTNTRFTATIKVKDYFDSIATYELSDTITVRPAPKVYKQTYVDVCQNNIVDADTLVDYNVIASVNWKLPPFGDGVIPNSLISIQGNLDTVVFPTKATSRYRCAYAKTNTFDDTLYLLKNKEPGIVEIIYTDFDSKCVNDTQDLFAKIEMTPGYVTWERELNGKIPEEIYRSRRENYDNLQDVIVDTATYSVKFTTACGSAKDDVILNPKVAPKIKAGPNIEVCLFDSAKISLKSNLDDIDQNNIAWYIAEEAFFTDTLEVPVNDTSDIFVTVRALGQNGCWGKDTMHILPQKLPHVKIKQDASAGIDTLCVKSAITSFTLTAEGASAYRWILPKDSTASSIRIEALDTTTVFCVIGEDDKGCRDTGRFYIAVIYPDDSVPPVGKDTICERSEYQLSASSHPDMISYWQTPDGSHTPASTLNIPEMAVTDTGVYKLIRLQHGCFDTTMLILSMKPTPNSKVESNVQELTTQVYALCANSDLVLNGQMTPIYSGTEQYWQTPKGDSNSASIRISQIRLSDSGTYKFITKLNGCMDSSEIRVRVDSMPKLSMSLDKVFYCEDDTLQITYFPQDADNYKLKLAFSADIISEKNPEIFGISQSDSGMAILVANKLTCEAVDSINIDIRQRPNPAPSQSKSQYCIGETIEINVDPENQTDYEWTYPDGSMENLATVMRNNITLNDSGNYYLNAVSHNGCKSYTDTVKIVIYSLPEIKFPDTLDHICMGDKLSISVFRPNASYRWNTEDETPEIEISTGGTYWVTVTENQCSDSASVLIEERLKPKFTLGNDTMVCFGTMLKISAAHTGISGEKYYWTTGEETSEINVSEAGTYILTAESQSCKWIDSLQLLNKFCGSFNDMPTAFRPDSEHLDQNGKYINRIFKPPFSVSKDILIYELFIYDKWGKLLFHSENIDEGWNGTHQGKQCQPGAYIYKIKAFETIQGTDLSKVGTVVLVQ